MEIIFITLFAAIIGSFLNMLIYRLPKMIQGEDVSPLYPQKSFCPHCKHSLNAKDLIPIVSFILCWGKCRYCNQAIYPRYLWTEMISVIVALLLYNTWGWTPQFGYFLILSLAFIILFWTDYETHLIPDIITKSTTNFQPFSLSNSIKRNPVMFFNKITFIIHNITFFSLDKFG
jgi:prepilin signal peptidase PulO-like enzyme (type II secretory pathway)